MTPNRLILPEFLIVGAQKSGTTWLLESLKRHPEVFMAPEEIHFFNNETHFDKGLDWYAQHFAMAKPNQLVGEKTPDYFSISDNGKTCKRLARHMPDAKLIVMLREPVSRTVSAVKHHIRMGNISPKWSLDDIINKKHDWVKQFSILNYSYYGCVLKLYQDHFPKENIKILFYENIRHDPKQLLKEACRFLDISYTGELLIDRNINAFKKSKLWLYSNYYAPWFNGVANRVDYWFLPEANLDISKKTEKSLQRLFADTKTYFNNQFNTPSEWKQP